MNLVDLRESNSRVIGVLVAILASSAVIGIFFVSASGTAGRE